MSRSMRAVTVKWGPAGSVFLDPERFDDLVAAVAEDELEFKYEWADADGVFGFWTGEGNAFLDRVRDCDPQQVIARLDEELRDDALSCLENLKALEKSWRGFIDKEGALEVWIDGY